jgi:nucleoside-diphosphate-sugar epimerase
MATRLAALFREHDFDCVINLAAQAGVRYSLENPQAYISSNINGFTNILECCRHASTAAADLRLQQFGLRHEYLHAIFRA